MKTKRFAVLLSTLVALAATDQLSKEIQSRIPTKVYQEHGYNKEGDRGKHLRISQRSSKYITKYVGQGGPGTIDLVDSSLKEEVGLTNFRANKMDIGNALIFDRVVVQIASNKTANFDVKKASYSIQMGPFENAELEIYSGGKLIVSLPLSAYREDNDNYFYELVSPGYLLDGQNFEIKLKMPGDLSGTSNYYAVRVILDGIETFV